jgi:SAM-dependent methyltransferase
MAKTNHMFPLQDYFKVPLIDMGVSNTKYTGVHTPETEIGRAKLGVSEILLSGAESYFEKFEQFDYIYSLLKNAINRFDRPLVGLAVDIGSGFGNTVIPVLAEHPDIAVLATDISPDLLAICQREATKRGFGGRCGTVAMDVEQDYLKHEIADVVFGGAILHHMIEPKGVVQTAINVLSRGGKAVFLEPFEAGNAVLRILYSEILREAGRRGESGPVFDCLRHVCRDIEVRTHRINPSSDFSWRQLDDKWLFTRSYFEDIAEEVGASDVHVEHIHHAENLFANQTGVIMESYYSIARSELKEWGWEIIRRFDEDFFSIGQKRDLYIEAMVTFTK